MRLRVGTLALLALALAPRPAAAGLIGQIDTFEDGTTQNWVVNLLGLGTHPAPPANAPDGGPAGAGDGYLLLTAVGGGGAGGRLTVINTTQWAGDYLSEGVTAFRMDLINLGTADLSLRLLFGAGPGGPPTDVAVSTVPVVLPAGGGWTAVEFAVTPADLTALTGSVTDALSGAFEVRLYHSPAVGFPGPPVAAQLGVDNVRVASAAVPEPLSAALAGAGLLALAGSRAVGRGRTPGGAGPRG